MHKRQYLTDEQKQMAVKLALDGKSYIQTANELGISPEMFRIHRERDPSFKTLLIQAREDHIDHLVTTVTDLVDLYDNPNAARAKFDAIKWRAAVTDPNKYGDRMQLDINQTIDMTAILRDAQARLSPLLDITPNEELQLQASDDVVLTFDDLK